MRTGTSGSTSEALGGTARAASGAAADPIRSSSPSSGTAAPAASTLRRLSRDPASGGMDDVGAVGQEPVVGAAQAVGQLDAVPPAERVQAADVEQLARCAVGLGGVEAQCRVG